MSQSIVAKLGQLGYNDEDALAMKGQVEECNGT
jgi:hypothetical protein